MKNKLLFLAVILLWSHSTFAQWNLNGNSIIPGQFLGSTNQQDLRFRVNDNPRMLLNYSSGFLGIGNYNAFAPQALIHANLLSFSKNGRLKPPGYRISAPTTPAEADLITCI